MKVKSYRSNQIGLQFRVWCPTFNRVRHRLFLLGSLPELGAWNIDAALEAFPTTEIHIWKTEAALPASSSFEWVWLRTAPNRTAVEWERFNKRNRTVDCYSGTLHTIWGESDEVFLQSATCLELTTFLTIDDGYTLVLSGSTPSTGLWNLSHALPAKEFPKKSGYWKVQISFDSFANLDFKWAVVKEKDHSIVRVEEKLHHSIYGRHCWMRVVAPWMLPVVVVVDTSILTDPMDNVLGRTDIIVRERRKRQEEIGEWIKVSTKFLLEEKKKAEAMGPRLSASHETLGSANVSSSSEKTKVSSISREPSVDLPRQPTVSANGNLDDLISKREELVTRESRTERLTKQLNKTYTEQVHVLKGLGQTEVPTDLINLDISNQVPLMDGGQCLLLFARQSADGLLVNDDTQSEDDVYQIDEGTSTSIAPTSKESTDLDAARRADSLLTSVERVQKKFSEFGDLDVGQEAGLASIETNIQNVASYPPPTWSMLQEEDIEKTRHPDVYIPSKAKTRVTVVPMIKAIQDKPTLLKSYQTLTQDRNLTDAASTSRGPFTPARGVSNPTIPSVIGMDDTSKTPVEITAEQVNRNMWERLRDEAGPGTKDEDEPLMRK